MPPDFEERRYTAAEDTAIEESGEARKIVGYAAVFNSPSQELPLKEGRSFREVVRPGAFANALLSKSDVLARFEHTQILGRTGNGTLRLAEDHRGLRYEIDPPNTTAGRDVLELIRRRDVPYSSFAFRVPKGGDTWRKDGGQLVRELRSVELIDIAPVAKPAYMATDTALRSLLDSGETVLDEDERNLLRWAMRLAIASRR